MIISKTPVRISFLGGGTDYPEAIAKWGGMVVGTAIDKHSYITARKLPPFFNYKTRLSYSKIETVCSNHAIEHKVIRNVLKHLNMLDDYAIEMSHISDLPSFSGTGSSSTFIVGLINALSRIKNPSKYCLPQELYNSAIEIEQHLLQDTVGYQDSAWAAFGGINVIKWKGVDPQITKIYLRQNALEYLQKSMMLFHTNISRDASKVAASYITSISEKESQHKQLLDLAEEGLESIFDYNYHKFGRILEKSWLIKQQYSPEITNPTINNMIDKAKEVGAIGCKLIGAGAGGCVFMIVEPHKRDYVQKRMEGLGSLHIPFDFEPEGSKIILEDK